MLFKADAMLTAVELVLFRHGEFLRGDEVKRRVEMPHCHDERVDGPAVFEVADKINIQILKRTLRLIDRVEVEQTL